MHVKFTSKYTTMKKNIFSILPLLFILGFSFQSYGIVSTPEKGLKKKPKKESAFKQLSTEEIFTMPKKDIESKIGRKLKFKEKLGLWIIQKAYKKAEKKIQKRRAKLGATKAKENLFGTLSISFAGLGLLSLFTRNVYGFLGSILFSTAALALGIIGLIRKEPKRFLSIIGLIISLIVLIILYVAIITFVIGLVAYIRGPG